MGDGVAPSVELIEAFAPATIPPIQRFHHTPECHAEAAEVMTDRARMRIPSIEPAIGYQNAM